MTQCGRRERHALRSPRCLVRGIIRELTCASLYRCLLVPLLSTGGLHPSISAADGERSRADSERRDIEIGPFEHRYPPRAAGGPTVTCDQPC